MKCYRVGCQCDEIKKMYCIFKLTEEQSRLIAEIKGHIYCQCGSPTVKAKYGGQAIDLCTGCGVRGRFNVEQKAI